MITKIKLADEVDDNGRLRIELLDEFDIVQDSLSLNFKEASLLLNALADRFGYTLI